MHTLQINAFSKRSCEQVLSDVQQILSSSNGDYPDLSMLAGAFNVSPRTLRRHLAAAGTCYQQELNAIRCRNAVNFLTTTLMPAEEIAEQLGFSDVTNFRHAFKKWKGVSPTAYRAQAA